MMKKGLMLALLLTITAALLFGHKPIFDDLFHGDFENALVIREPQVSQITYHEFTDEEPVFWITFLGEKDEEIQIVLNVPYQEKFSDMEVYMALFRQVSDDLDTVWDRFATGEFPFEAPLNHQMVLLYSGLYEREFFHEPFSNTDSWFVLRQRFTPLERGVYYVAIWPEQSFSPGGKIGFSIGVLERFTPLDLFKLPQWIEGIRQFHEE